MKDLKPKHGMLHMILAVSWLFLGVWEIADKGHTVFAWVCIITAVAWLACSIYNMRHFKKKE